MERELFEAGGVRNAERNKNPSDPEKRTKVSRDCFGEKAECESRRVDKLSGRA